MANDAVEIILDEEKKFILWRVLTEEFQDVHPLAKKQVIEIVQNLVDEKGIDSHISMSWWKSFQSRHKGLNYEKQSACHMLV